MSHWDALSNDNNTLAGSSSGADPSADCDCTGGWVAAGAMAGVAIAGVCYGAYERSKSRSLERAKEEEEAKKKKEELEKAEEEKRKREEEERQRDELERERNTYETTLPGSPDAHSTSSRRYQQNRTYLDSV
ncbi:TPA_asm: hypothetical protein [Sphaeridiorhabdovirus 1]|nr:TPA_asm: hypothetical protein [Sphaeridiorhabdovirus 1]